MEKMYEEGASKDMGISRQTFVRVLRSSLEKITDALVNSKEIKIDKSGKVQRILWTKKGIPSRFAKKDFHVEHSLPR